MCIIIDVIYMNMINDIDIYMISNMVNDIDHAAHEYF